MTTRRESYVAALMAQLAGSAALRALGVTVERSVFEAISSHEGSVLVVHRGRDTPVSSLGVTDRQCVLMLTAVVRDASPDRAADSIFEAAHPIVMGFDADRLLGVTEGPTGEPQAGDVEGGVGVITIQYLLQYQTAPNSLA
jgi:hypothetical protein